VNAIDLLLVAIVGAGMFYGWKSGLLRLVVAVSATMFGFMVANQFYEPLGRLFSAAAVMQVPNVFMGLAYLFLLFLAAGTWFIAIRKLYPYSRLVDPEVGGPIWLLDRFGGLLLGSVLGIMLAIATVGVVELLVFYPWPALMPQPARDVIHVAFRDAGLVRGMFSDTPWLASVASHWVPGVAIAQEAQALP
jgi:uncharacterized membrane protein required for colicin V production